MSKPDDIPQDVWDEAVSALERAWDEHAEHFNPLSNTFSEGLWQRFFEATARAILAERERCAKIADDYNIDSRWPHLTDEEINLAHSAQNVTSDDIADAIRKGD